MDYHQHTSEYGVHWNFFFTLAVISMLSAVVENIFPGIHPRLLGTTILLVYQAILSGPFGVEQWLLSHPEDRPKLSYVAQNKEGK